MSNKRRFTPERITELGEGEIFVFGSNLNGYHAGGAARMAASNFGAKFGQGEGLQGQSYALPTLSKDMKRLPIEQLESSLDRLIECANKNSDLTFFMTKVGCGIAGFKVGQIAQLFFDREIPENIVLPREFVKDGVAAE